MLSRKLKYILILFILLAETTTAQFYFFGRNKVQYEKFDWKVLKTEHFDIYYYDEFLEIAEIGANFAEEAYEKMKVKFNHYETRRIPLIFYNTHIHFKQTNVTPAFIGEGTGGFFEFLKGRVVVPYVGSVSKFKTVITHEIVHVFMTGKIYDMLRNRRIPTGKMPPLWFVEGLADYWCERLETVGEMVMRDAVLNNFHVHLQDLIYLRGFLMYKEGQNFLKFVSSYYGEEKILQLMDNLWRFDKFSEVLEFTLGEDIESIDNKWYHSLRQTYYPLLAESEPHKVNSVRLTEEGINFCPNFYSDGDKKYVYSLANIEGYSSIYKQELDDDFLGIDDPEIVLRGEKESVFESFHLQEPSLTLSKNGLIGFITKAGRSDAIHIFSIKDDEVIITLRWDDIVSIQSIHFSNDGSKILFSATDKKGFNDLFTLELSSKNITRLTNDYYEDKDAIFNETGDKVVFTSDRTEGIFNKTYNLFELDLKTNEIEYLTYANANIGTPHYSPDFSELFFTSDYDGANNLYKLEFDDDKNPVGMIRYSNFLTSLFNFTFTDNETIITSAFEEFSFHFYKVELDKAPDKIKKFVSFDFENAYGKWEAEKISANEDVEKLNYENKYTLDYAVSQVVTDPIYGSRGGALLALSDMLGDDKYIILIYNTAQLQSDILKNFNVAITKINYKHRTNFGYGIFHYSGRRYDIRESNQFFYERAYGGFFSLSYPFSFFQRLEMAVSLANSDKEIDFELNGRKSLLMANTISFVHDNSIWGPTGPMDGSRFRILLGYITDLKYSNVNYYSFIVDYRKYQRISLRTALAARAAIFINHGKEARRYFAGGSWDLRGWPRWSIRGEKLWLTSLEFRYPLIDKFVLGLPFINLQFSGIRGALFFDAGGAWDNKYRQTLGSIGAGVRINLLNVITIRYDIGKKIENDFSQLQPKLFYQFYFGWDF